MAFRPVGIMAFTMMLFAVRRWLLNRERSARQPNRFQCKLYRLWFLLGLAGMPRKRFDDCLHFVKGGTGLEELYDDVPDSTA